MKNKKLTMLGSNLNLLTGIPMVMKPKRKTIYNRAMGKVVQITDEPVKVKPKKVLSKNQLHKQNKCADDCPYCKIERRKNEK